MRYLMLAVLAACGLGPSPDAQDPPAGAGNAPWAELGAATVCLGNLAIDAPTAVPGGLCLSPLTPGTHGCDTASECRSRESCVCGVCVVAYCATLSDCPDDRICDFGTHRCDHTCTKDTQCADGEQCLAGACRGRCATSSECEHGEVCDRNHVCITDDCVDASGCLGGETCEMQRTPRQLLEPDPVRVGDTTVIYFDLAPPDQPLARAIWRATSRDARHFVVDPAAPIIAAGWGPSTVTAGGTTYLYYEDAAGLEVATSTDGVAFGAPALALAGPAAAPGAVILDGTVAVYYQRDGSIGLATGPLGGALADQGTVLSPADVTVGDPTNPTGAFWNPVTRLSSPHPVLAGPDGAGPVAGATVHLYFAAFGQESAPAIKHDLPSPIPPNVSIGFAAAEPGEPGMLAVWPYGPIYDHVDVFTQHDDELGPAAVRLEAGWRLYYIDATRDPPAGVDGPYLIGRLVVLGSGR